MVKAEIENLTWEESDESSSTNRHNINLAELEKMARQQNNQQNNQQNIQRSERYKQAFGNDADNSDYDKTSGKSELQQTLESISQSGNGLSNVNMDDLNLEAPAYDTPSQPSQSSQNYQYNDTKSNYTETKSNYNDTKPNYTETKPNYTENLQPEFNREGKREDEMTRAEQSNSIHFSYEAVEQGLEFEYPFDNYTAEFRSKAFQPRITDEWDTITLPSNGIQYNPIIRAKKLKVRHIVKLRGAIEAKSMTACLNILDACIDMDIRDLTQPDFTFMMYWWRLNSFPKTPLTLTWYSKYGNKNVSTLNKTNLSIIQCDAKKEDIRYFKELGMCYPTVRDLEYKTINDLSSEDEWTFDCASYFTGKTINEKLDNLDNHSEDFQSDIDKMKKLFEHGIEEKIYTKDLYFNKEKYVSSLNEKKEYINDRLAEIETKYMASPYSERQEEEEAVCYQALEAINEELSKIKNIESAEEEEITIPFRVVNILPDIQLTADSE